MAGTKQGENTKIKDSGAKETERFPFDDFWKDLVKRFFYLLIKRAIPSLYEEANRNKEPDFLDKEFQDILLTSDKEIRKNPHYADLLVKVPLKNGDERRVLLHVEAQQSHKGGYLPERMNHYRSLIYAHHREEPVALAITTGVRPKKEANYYSHYHFGTELIYKYNNLVLSELDDDVLLSSDNPIDIVLYAAKFAIGKNEERQKFNFLRKTIELLGERGWSLNDKRDLLLFTERIVNMKDEALMVKYSEILRQYKEEGKNMYIPIALRDQADDLLARGMEKGREKGREEGKLEMARNLLANGFTPDVIAESAGLPLDQIQSMMN
ncbi:hypothetical protein AGMMS50276_03070 [Synergistales bacterium]|nr:hypothetical protein AGMMS50276_03070 [Synergistales bacterium]